MTVMSKSSDWIEWPSLNIIFVALTAEEYYFKATSMCEASFCSLERIAIPSAVIEIASIPSGDVVLYKSGRSSSPYNEQPSSPLAKDWKKSDVATAEMSSPGCRERVGSFLSAI